MANSSKSKKVPKKVLIASLIGSSVEWFDYFLYGTVATLVFSKLFFPNDDPQISLLLSYASFAIPFLIRPLGGILFSHIGDKIGRKKSLVMTLSLMGSGTVLMGLLPDYNTIGIWAPILLVLLRCIQGLGLGGEWGGALLLAFEYAPKEKRGFFGSIPQMGVTIGLLLGTLVLSGLTLLPEEQFLSWGWRIPFIFSAALVILGLWIRKGIDETPEFQETQESKTVSRVPIVDIFRYHWKAVLITIGAKFVDAGPFYIFATFIITYANTNLGFDETTALNAVTIAAVIATVMIPLMGILSDKIGRKSLYIAGSSGIILFAFPYFYLLNLNSSLWLTIATVLAIGIIWPAITAIIGPMFAENFSANVRYTGVSFGYQIGSAISGGTAPLIAVALMGAFNNSWVPVALFIMANGLISLISVLFLPKTMPEVLPKTKENVHHGDRINDSATKSI
ncbi:MFS transporter [Peribacillus cavernae]|uniref:Putative proline/betaine transporter n=1 Tax=Peribacillus cavernae TaxID=1674310 RepID=A0A3S0U901_9BACI|nr:MFS transporter [Peribacillus cavernae]MDQ0218154.1 metabolite-proton symporter [Peribacillus cavernae]RUQ32696.1 MFS transporter [Peribacillus cavernae]